MATILDYCTMAPGSDGVSMGNLPSIAPYRIKAAPPI
jgi:hypothetical protein